MLKNVYILAFITWFRYMHITAPKRLVWHNLHLFVTKWFHKFLNLFTPVVLWYREMEQTACISSRMEKLE